MIPVLPPVHNTSILAQIDVGVKPSLSATTGAVVELKLPGHRPGLPGHVVANRR